MILSEFVQNTLTEIVLGVKAAQKIEGCEGLIAPGFFAEKAFPPESGLVGGNREIASVVKLDVAVTSGSQSEVDASGKGKILVVAASLDGSLQLHDETVSRIQFSIPIMVPKG